MNLYVRNAIDSNGILGINILRYFLGKIMRLEIQLKVLLNVINKIKIKSNPINNDVNRMLIDNIKEIVEGLDEIRDFNYLDPELSELKSIDYFFNFVGDRLVVNNNNFNTIERLIRDLRYKIQTNIGILESLKISSTELTLCIKIIEFDSLKEIADELATIDKILNQVISHEKLKGEYKFTNFDIGTSWIFIVVNSMITLSAIASVIWSASVIRKKIIEGNISNEYLKQMKIKTDSMEDIKNAQKVLIKNLIETEAVNIMSEYKLDDTNHEYKERLIWAIGELSELIVKGVEVQPATISSEEVKNLFPNFEKLDMIESKVKLLENKKK
jgi:hypothetical protein